MAKKLPTTTTRVEKGDDGVYRWTYALNMLTNPAILVTVLKIIVPLFSIPLIVTLIRTAIDNSWAEASGFSSRAAFLRTFKAQTGLTPTEWKQKEGIDDNKNNQ